MSIRLRLTIWYSTILALTLLVSGVVVYIFVSHYLISNQKDHMEQLSKDVRSQMSAWTFRGQPNISIPPLDEFQYPGFFMQIVAKDGRIVIPANNRALFPIPTGQEALNAANQNKFYYKSIKIGTNSLLVLNTPLNVADSKIPKEQQFVGYLQVAVKVNDINKVLNDLLYVLALLAIVIIIAAASFGWFLARKALKPIDLVIEATDQIEKGADLARRIEYLGPQDEIGRLTNKINNMLARIQITYSDLEETNRAQRRFVSDASHELRTPLTTIRGNVDLLQKMWRQIERQSAEEGKLDEDSSIAHSIYDPFQNREKLALSLEAMTDISSEAARMSRLVNDLLSLARADSGYTINKKPILLLPLVEEVIRKAQQLPKTADWRKGDLSPLLDILVYGDEDYLQQLLFIFIENAFKYTPSGFVLIEAIRAKDQIGIRIQDTGLGMDKLEVPRIFDRFYRADQSRGETAGTGLGLSIAQWIIDEHRGSIEVTTRKNEGSTFIIWLPIYQPTYLQ
jgi:two-component system, OmpR family, sensor kinase